MDIKFLKYIYSKKIHSTYAKETVCLSLGGSSTEDIHAVVKNIASEEGLMLNTDTNWKKDKGDAICSTNDAKRISNKLKDWPNMGNKSLKDYNLLIIGKSAGGVLAWNS